MTREEKVQIVEELKEKFEQNEFFYITDASTLTVEQINDFRRKCFENNVEMLVCKNTLATIALKSFDEERNYEPLLETLKGPTALMFTETANAPARIIKEFRESFERPVIKGAYIQSDIYLGDESLVPLSELKSREELLGEIVMLLQSPAKNVLGALTSAGSTIAGLLKAIEEKNEAAA